MILCENGYIKDGVRGILCRKCEEPKDGSIGKIAHALCGHQRFCPSQRCYTLLPSWEKCTRRQAESTTPQSAAERDAPLTAPLTQGSQMRAEAAGSEIAAETGKAKAKKKSANTGAKSV